MRKVRKGHTKAVRAARELHDILENEKGLRARKKELRAIVQDYMGDDEELWERDSIIATWRNFTRVEFDMESFKKEHPKLASQYSYSTNFRRFCA